MKNFQRFKYDFEIMVDYSHLVPKGQFVLIAFCALQTLLNIHLYRGKLATDRDTEFAEYQKVKAFQRCQKSLKKCQNTSQPVCQNVTISTDARSAKYNDEPSELTVPQAPNIFSVADFNYDSISFPQLDECSCEEGMKELDSITNVKVKNVQYVAKFKDRTVTQSRKRRHEDYRKRREWSQPAVLYSNPSVPLKYPSSGLKCQPRGYIEIPMLVTEYYKSMKIVVVSKYGQIAVGIDGTPQLKMELEGDSTYINKLLKSLVYKNKMYDSILYHDTVTVWIKGFESVQFQVLVEKTKLEVLQVNITNNYIKLFLYQGG